MAINRFSTLVGRKPGSIDSDTDLEREAISGTPGDDVIFGGPGAELIRGRGGNDRIDGGDGNDTIRGGRGNDTLDGGFGDDMLSGGAGNDVLDGGSGNDVIFGGGGDDLLHADGTDPDHFSDTLNGGMGDDTYDLRSLQGSSTLHVLQDDGGIDTVLASGEWTLGAGFENLTLDAGGFEGSFSGFGNELDNVMTAVSNPFASAFLHGAAGDDTLIDGIGRDRLFGEAGDDRLEVGADGEGDRLSGGEGRDSFVFRAPDDPTISDREIDSVADFGSGIDRLVFDNDGFTAVGGEGAFADDDARFYAAADASAGHDADDRLVYNTSTGDLYYDADGSGAGAAQLIATLDGAAALAATDISVI
jgi:serralysin